jgi:glutamate formiminotransferase
VSFPLEAVPNISEGRDRATVEAVAAALAGHARLLDVHSDPDHNRSVFTLAGQEHELIEALLAGIACARERIDLRRHAGAHPRVGSADVVPVVAVREEDRGRAQATALELARRVGGELGLPVFLYGEVGEGRGPAFFRRGGLEELRRRLDEGELEVDFGPKRLDPAAGAVLVGARRPLIAFNVDLRTGDLEVARAVAAVVREAGGGFRGVRALGFALPSRGLVQVSMNVEEPEAAPLHEIVARIVSEAAARGVEVDGSELVGLLPAATAAGAAGSALRLEGLDPSRLLELRLLESLRSPR